jgi:hypothetical protein
VWILSSYLKNLGIVGRMSNIVYIFSIGDEISNLLELLL